MRNPFKARAEAEGAQATEPTEPIDLAERLGVTEPAESTDPTGATEVTAADAAPATAPAEAGSAANAAEPSPADADAPIADPTAAAAASLDGATTEPPAEAAPGLVEVSAAPAAKAWARPGTEITPIDPPASLADPAGSLGEPLQLREPIVELVHVGRTYHLGNVDVNALIDATLTVRRGEFIAIVGPSGSGKSTLMNIIGCLDRATAGLYSLAGTPIDDLSDDDLARVRSRTIGFVFQSYNLLPRTSALENVATPLMYQGVGRRERHERAAAALSRLGLGDRLNHVPTELSGGQQQRVAIARALVTDPALILADEPTGNLDSHSGAEVMNILHELHESGRTIVMITHDAKVAAQAPRNALISDGVLTLPDEAVAA